MSYQVSMEYTTYGAIFIIVTSFFSANFCLATFRFHLESLSGESTIRLLNVLYYQLSIYWQCVTVLASANIVIVVILDAPEESNIVKGNQENSIKYRLIALLFKG